MRLMFFFTEGKIGEQYIFNYFRIFIYQGEKIGAKCIFSFLLIFFLNNKNKLKIKKKFLFYNLII